jgi:hypothetical protein
MTASYHRCRLRWIEFDAYLGGSPHASCCCARVFPLKERLHSGCRRIEGELARPGYRLAPSTIWPTLAPPASVAVGVASGDVVGPLMILWLLLLIFRVGPSQKHP